MIKAVRLSAEVERDLRRGRIPAQVQQKLIAWVGAVVVKGLEEVRKVPGYHDEPLHGDRRGQRSIRLNKQWRAIYVVVGGVPRVVQVVEVIPHSY